MREQRIMKMVLAVVLGLLVLLGCQFLIGTGVATLVWKHWPTQSPVEAWFDAARIQEEDLPRGWRYAGGEIEDVPGGEARLFWFYGPPGEDKPWVKVVQELVLYPSFSAADSAYEEWVDTYIPPVSRDKWVQPSVLKFQSQADHMVVACLSGYVNEMHHYACSAIGRYGNVVVVLLANVFDDRWLTMADFRRVLEAMDWRIVAAQKDTH